MRDDDRDPGYAGPLVGYLAAAVALVILMVA